MKKGRLMVLALSTGICVAAYSGRAQQMEAPDEAPRDYILGLRLWSVSVDGGYRDDSGEMFYLYYDNPLENPDWVFSAKLGYGDIGATALEAEVGIKYVLEGAFCGLGYDFINYSTSLGQIGDGDADVGSQHGPELLVGFRGFVGESNVGYHLGATWLPLVFSSEADGEGSGLTWDIGLEYEFTEYRAIVGYRQQEITLDEQYWDSDIKYSGLYVQVSKWF